MTTNALNKIKLAPGSNQKPEKNHLVWWIILGVLLVTVGVVGWEKRLKNQFFVARWAQVEPGLYRSSEMSRAMCEYMLKKYGIQVIISLGADTPGDPDKLPEQQAAAKLGIERTAIAMSGNGTGTLASYVQALTLLIQAKQAHKTVLVHCGSGTQRTGGVIASYKMLTENVSPQQALADMESFDFSATNNPVLLPFLNRIMPELAQRLKEQGTLQTIPNPIPVLVE